MTAIRAVFFDLGGVIVRTEDKGPRTRLAERLGLTYEGLARVVFEGGGDHSGARATIGQISEQEHWRNVVRSLGLPDDQLEQVRDDFFAGDVVDVSLLDFLRSLHPGRKTGLISNAWSGLRAWLEANGHADAFDVLTISAEAGVAKPAPGIFERALEAAGVQAAEAAFLDDFPENVEASRALGMQAIQFRSAEQALGDLRRLLEL